MPKGKKAPQTDRIEIKPIRSDADPKNRETPLESMPENGTVAPAIVPSKIGRPSDYRPEYAKQAEKLYAAGFTDVEIATFFETSVGTLYRWAQRNPEFREAQKVGKMPADDRVEMALYHRAIGYTFERTKYIKVDGGFVPVLVKEHLPPDTTAAMHWLKNRRPDKWRDVQQVEHGRPGEFQAMTDQELRNAVLEMQKDIDYLVEDGTKKSKH